MRRLLLSYLIAPALAAAEAPAAIDSVVERALMTFGNQGAAITVVKDGKVIVAKRFGVKKVGAPDEESPTRASVSRPKAKTSPPLRAAAWALTK